MPKGNPNWKKGQSGNPAGKPKGTKCKFTTLKDAFLDAFQEVGGKDALVKFAKGQDKKEFFKMVAHMLPKDIHVSGAEGEPIIPPKIEFVFVAATKEATK